MTVNKPMTKTQIVAHIAEKFELPKKVAGELIAEFADLAVEQTRQAGEFTIPGIGKLVKAQRAARTGRDPRTGKEIPIPEKTVVKMRLSKACKDAIVPPK